MAARVLPARKVIALLVPVALLTGLWLARHPVLRGIGRFLIREDPPARADALYVLGGASLDRGREAARMVRAGWCGHAWFTGSNTATALEAVGIAMRESEVGLEAARRAGLPPGTGSVLRYGTSTAEEADVILAHAHHAGHDTVMVLSSRFHLRRVYMVFERHPRKAGVTVLLHGAPSTQFMEEEWWRDEDGLVMLTNEYLKLLYYAWRY